MINIRHTVSALALSSLLVFGGCGKKDKGDAAGLPELGSLSVKGADAGVIEKMLEVEDRKVADAEAEQALKGLGLDEGGSISWDSKKGKAGDYQYTNLSFKSDEDKDVVVSDLRLDGVHMDADEPSFDRMTLSGVKISDEDSSGTIDRLILSDPNPAMAAKILKGLGKFETLDDLDMDVDIEDGEFGFGAMLMQGMDMKSDDGLIKVDTLGWGRDDDTGKGAFVARDITFSGTDKSKDVPVTMSLKSASARDLDMRAMEKLKDNMGTGGMPRGMSPFQSMYGNINVEDFKLNADAFSINMVGIEAQTSTKGDVTTERQILKPLTISFSGPATDPQMKQAQQAFTDMGFETLEFTGKSTKVMNKKTDSLTVKDAHFALKDGFNLSYDLKASGIGSATDMSAAMDDMTIDQMTLSLTDHSIVDKAITLAAKMQGGNPALMRMQAKGGLMFLTAMGETPKQKEMLAEAANAAGKFLDDGGTLVVNFNPSSPVSIADMQSMGQSPDQAIDKLGLSISHKQ